ncbi:NAD(P)/FAD-dependent oxidoreductase [Amycolatopsis thermophila]|uniref:NADPH-dependent 2,4-dienoyl-CoA reductase/sulfur reductase-like enzyme n=1 Tax=Amycolatopsis thermophila TaxID=206084 RepID=A0ABU0F5T1_9PSEU|nr:FAD-dependent oxidoreductase [Amycolatopsis thermophila]MDQ0382873.1 NADPH-dependent 2,4-dienoyl-CoA reductase/sulfur reductase-like enzyme [Amycolatopsis thermophila]
MTSSSLRRIVVVGGSIAAVTAAEALRVRGFDGDITVLSEETSAPYSRVPLSKGVLCGKETPDSALLPPLDGEVSLRLGTRAAGLRVDRRRVVCDDGDEVPYDGLVIATGARARRLARPGQAGEHVVRTLDDATRLAGRIATAGSVIVVGAGFLGMEVASTCTDLGLAVTVVDRDPPLRRLLGGWLADLVVGAARDRGVRFVRATRAVELAGGQEVTGVRIGDRVLTADVVVSAVGDVPGTGWLADSGLPLRGGLVVDDRCRVAPDIVAAGDVTVSGRPGGEFRRSPHWTSAVIQGQVAAATLLHGEVATLPRPDAYYWTEQFGLDIKISGEIPDGPAPTVLAGDPRERSALLQWRRNGRGVAAVSVNHRMPIVKLKRLGAWASAEPG